MDMVNVKDLLTTAWWCILGFSFFAYLILDGADLGAGVISLFVKDPQEKGAIMASMAGTWDANETWLVVAGGVMFGTFPYVYGSAFHYLMVPLALALWGIISRAIALEFYHHADSSKRFWGFMFGFGSLITPYFAGMAMGAALMGFPMTSMHPANAHPGTGPFTLPTYAGGPLNFVSPFSIWTGFGALIAVALAGSLFIRARFEKHCPIRKTALTWANTSFYLALAAVVVTVVWSIFLFPWAAHKWLGSHWWVWLLVLLGTVFAAFKTRQATANGHDMAAILWLDLVVLLMWGGMMGTMYPWIVPNTWTIFGGASPNVSLVTFTMAMIGFFPIMVFYNAYQWWVFRGRITKLVAYGH